MPKIASTSGSEDIRVEVWFTDVLPSAILYVASPQVPVFWRSGDTEQTDRVPSYTHWLDPYLADLARLNTPYWKSLLIRFVTVNVQSYSHLKLEAG